MMQHSVLDHQYLKYLHHGVLPCSLVTLWLILYIKITISRVKLDPSSLAHLRDVFFKDPLFAFWPSGVAQPSLPCFVSATPSGVAHIAGQGEFAFSLPAPQPICEAEFLAFFSGIGTYRPISNNIHLIEDNLEVLSCLKKGSSRNLFADEILKSLAYFSLTRRSFLTFRILNQLIIQLICILIIFKLIGQFFKFRGFCVFCRILL